MFRRWFRKTAVQAPLKKRGFLRDDRGTTLIEFALLGVPFFSIIGAILETAMIFFAGQVLDSAVQDASRFVRTGEAGGFSLTQFRTTLCNRLYGLFDCTKLRINVSVINNFSSATIELPYDPDDCTPSDCDWTLAENYNAGTGSDVILVRVFYRWPTIIDFGGFNLQNIGDGSRLLAGVRVFRNEPYSGA